MFHNRSLNRRQPIYVNSCTDTNVVCFMIENITIHFYFVSNCKLKRAVSKYSSQRSSAFCCADILCSSAWNRSLFERLRYKFQSVVQLRSGSWVWSWLAVWCWCLFVCQHSRKPLLGAWVISEFLLDLWWKVLLPYRLLDLSHYIRLFQPYLLLLS